MVEGLLFQDYYYYTIKRKVITMKEGKKQRGPDPIEQCDSVLIFARVTALMSTRPINLNEVLKYELAKVVSLGFQSQSVSSSEDSTWKLPIPQEASDTLWSLVDVPYSRCYNGPAKDSSRMSC